MRLFGLEITRQKAVPAGLQSVSSSSWRSWFGFGGPVMESYPGAWQRNVVLNDKQTLLASSAVYACVTGIASDVAKMRIKLCQNKGTYWQEVTESPFLKVLRKPNHYQNRINFVEDWILSKLLCGNTYVLKERETARGLVRAMYVLNPALVTPLVAPDGSVFYEIRRDDLSGVEDTIAVPASEIIHDRMAGLWHPLVGVSPLYACAVTATMQNRMQDDSTSFFNNRSMPGGIVDVPGPITQELAAEIRAQFNSSYSGINMGKTAVLSDGMKFTPIRATNENSQLAELLKFTVEDVARAFHYPMFKLGGEMPAYSSGPEAVTTMYYTDCLQKFVEKLELSLDEGLEFPEEKNYGTECDLDNLMRMDKAALYKVINEVGKIAKVDEQRAMADLPPLPFGGDTVYRQEQDHSIEALARRDSKEDPFAKAGATPEPKPPQLEAPPAKELTPEDIAFFEAELEAELELV